MYTVDASSDEPIMLLNKHIGYDPEDGYGIDGALFQEELLRLDGMGKKRIQVWINSPGGLVVDGMGIYHAILKSKTKVDTYNVGLAASIAAVIFQAGRKRIMSDYAVLMYHNAFNGADKSLEVLNESINQMISRSGMNKDEIESMMNCETFLDAEEAKRKRLCDEIDYSVDLNKKRLPATVTESQNFWKERNTILNNIFKSNTKNMVKVTNKLNLQDSANEDAIVGAISEIQNKLDLATVENKKSKDELEKMKNDLDTAENSLKEMKDKYEAAKNDLDTAADLAMTEKCKNMISGFVKIGKIKNEAKSIDAWVAKAKVDFDGVKNLIDELPLNKTAAIVDNKNEDQAAITGGKLTAALAMAQITAKNEQKNKK